MRFRVLLSLLVMVVLQCATAAFAQNYQGNIRGIVKDASGATVTGAKVTLTEESKLTVRTTISNNDGQYVFNAIDPGSYSILVEQSGFSKFEQTGVKVEAQSNVTQDLTLAVGSTAEVVEVKAAAVQLDTSDASSSTSFTAAQINDMPTLSGPGRSPFTASQLAPTITPNAGQNSGSSDQSNISYVTVAGSPEATNLYLVDGIPIVDTTNRPSYIPPIEAIQEQKTQIVSYDAEMSRTGGGVFNTVLKSGTNGLHGSLYYVMSKENFNANNFFNNRTGIARSPINFYNYASSIGGPVYIPKVYNGRDKTFFFMAEEGYRNPTYTTGQYIIPSALERVGDFSQSVTSTGAQVKIYDPATTVVTTTGGTTTITRTQFPGNVIPVGRRNSVGLKYLSYLPNPDVPGAVYGATNYIAPLTKGAFQRDDVFVAKLDHQFFPWFHAAASYTHYGSLQPFASPLSAVATTATRFHRKVDATTFNAVLTPSAKMVVALRFGFNRFPQDVFPTSLGYSPTNLGLPDYGYQQNFFPTATISGFQTLGAATGAFTTWSSRNFSGTVNYSLGRHSLRAGVDVRRLHMDYQDFSDAPSDYTFSGIFTSSGATAASGANGSAIADMVLGAPITGQIGRSQKFYQYVTYLGFFAQDDFRVNSKLTLNLGLRYEYETGLKEKTNSEVVGFSTTAASPLASYYAATKGGLLYAGVDGKTQCCSLSKLKFSPKVGFSYAASKKTVVHGGFQILYVPMRYDNTATLNTGYTALTPIVSTNDGGRTISATFSFNNPFPSGPLNPTGNAARLLSGIGTPISAYDAGFKSPYIMQYSLGVQRDLGWGTVIEAAYVGSEGRHLNTTPQGTGTFATGGGKTNIDQLSPAYFSMGKAALNTAVANPYYGHGGVGTIGNATVAAQQLLLPFPQFTSVNLVAGYASSAYYAMYVQAVKRATKGLTLSSNFTWSRNMDSEYGLNSVGPQNVYDLKSEYSQSFLDLPFRTTTNANYWLPVGRGQKFLGHVNRITDLAIGGWQVNVTNVVQSGNPLSITQNNQNTAIGTSTQRPNLNPGIAIKASGSKFDRINKYLNSAAKTGIEAFSVVGTSTLYQFGNAPRVVSARGFGRVDFDGSMQKSFHLFEGSDLLFRAEVTNMFNHPDFAKPASLVYDSTTYGLITATSNNPRYIKLGGRLTF